MRFRKSLRLCRGVRLNFSGSGVSMTLGGRGASVTVGHSGVAVNYGIPGTGLHNRIQLNTPSKRNKQVATRIDQEQYNYDIKIDDTGHTSLVVKDRSGNVITSNSIIARIKKSEEYKIRLDDAIAKKRYEIEENTLALIHIGKLSEKLIDFAEVRKAYEKITHKPSPETYFTQPCPTKEEVIALLEREAVSNISSIFFWTNETKRKKYVEDNFSERYQKLVAEWEEKKQAFVNKQLKELEIERKKYEKLLQTNIEGIYASINEVLENISLPVDFVVNYEIKDRVLFLDLDLPEIEDVPIDKVVTFSSGKISVKPKTNKEIMSDYALCVCGMPFFFASLMFNTTPEIDKILVSAYTQRENKKNRQIEDQYVYSVLLDREHLATIDFRSFDPIRTIFQFPHNIKLTSTNNLETIDIQAPLSRGVNEIESSSIGNRVKTSLSVDSSQPHELMLYDEFFKKPVKVIVPSDSILVQIEKNDRTVYRLSSEAFIKVKYYSDKDGKSYILVNKKEWKKAQELMEKDKEREDEVSVTATLNNTGISYEKEGKEDEAIAIYEENVARKCKASHSYDRLLVLYKKRKDIENEIRIAKLAHSLFPQESKYKKRLDKLMSAPSDDILPQHAIVYNASIKHGDLFEKAILDLPEFDFYYNGASSNAYRVTHKQLEPIWALQKYFKDLIEAAESSEANGDYMKAATLYEQIIAENYWMPAPCDRLVKIYAKAKLVSDEIRVLQYGVEHFSKLKEQRYHYLKLLATKYKSIEFFNERINNGGKITYFNGVFELYNPFPIIEKWKARLMKKSIH